MLYNGFILGENNMSYEDGLNYLRTNHEVVKVVDNEVEIEVTTFAHLQPVAAGKMVAMGWIRRADNVFAWLKPQYTEETPLDENEEESNV